MGDQYDKCFECSQRLGYEGRNLEEYIEKRIAESYNPEERLPKLEHVRKNEVSKRQRAKAAKRKRSVKSANAKWKRNVERANLQKKANETQSGSGRT